MLLALLTLAGCADLARTPRPIPTRTSTPPPTATPLPTLTPTPEPTATPEPTPTTPVTSGCDASAGHVDVGQFPSGIVAAGQSVYAIYFPPCYDTRLRYPVIYLMHGSPNFDESHWLDLGFKDAADRAIASRRVPPFLAVLPRGDVNGAFGNTSGGPGSWEQVMVDELIPYVDTTYNTLGTKEGRAIGGISRGAVWALEIAFRRPDLFSAVGGHSSALSVNLAAPAFDPLEIVQTDQASTLGELRILLDAGDTDWALQKTAELHALLDVRGIHNTFLVGRGAHAAVYWSSQMGAYVDFYASAFAGLIEPGVTP
jgi:enterochelin esterase-like enzyme